MLIADRGELNSRYVALFLRARFSVAYEQLRAPSGFGRTLDAAHAARRLRRSLAAQRDSTTGAPRYTMRASTAPSPVGLGRQIFGKKTRIDPLLSRARGYGSLHTICASSEGDGRGSHSACAI